MEGMTVFSRKLEDFVAKTTVKGNKPERLEEEICLVSGTEISTFSLIPWFSGLGEDGPAEKGPAVEGKMSCYLFRYVKERFSDSSLPRRRSRDTL